MPKQAKRPTKATKRATSVTELALAFESPESSLILRGRYDPTTQTLAVDFTSGKTYTYAGVSPEMWTELLAADSKGKYFNAHVRPFIVGREQK